MQWLFSFFSSPRRFVVHRWKMLVVIILVIGVGGFFFWKNTHKKVAPLTFAHPERKDLVQTLDVSGVINAKQKAELSFANGGKITYLGFKEGDWVKRSQVVARIDSRDLQKQLEQNLNLYFNQRMDFEQGKDNRRDLAPTNLLDRTAQKEQKVLENKVLDVERTTISAQNTVLSSPVDGVLVASPVTTTGVNLLPTQFFEVINPKTLVFQATVDQADIASVKKDQPVKITLDAYPDNTLESRVSFVSYKSLQSSSGTVFVVEVPIPISSEVSSASALEKYRLGMNGDAQIIVRQKNDVLAILLAALKERDGKKLVTLKKEDPKNPTATEEKEIETGIETSEEVEVTKGLSERDQVVIP